MSFGGKHLLPLLVGIVLSANPVGAMAAGQAEWLVANEIMVANNGSFLDPSYNYGAWVELYNPTQASIALDGCFVSDDASDLEKWPLRARHGEVPALGFAVLWFGHYDAYGLSQIGFKLQGDGGQLFLSDRQGHRLTLLYPAAIGRCSYARTQDGGDEWEWTSTPSPGKTNAGSTFAREQLAAPRVSEPSRLFSDKVLFSVDIPEGCTLVSTGNGSVPTLTNGLQRETGQFTVRSTGIYRFRLYKDGYLPSEVVTRTFVRSTNDYHIPVVFVTANEADLSGSDHGIFAIGPHGRPGNGNSSSCNYNMDWDRPAHFEYLDENGNLLIDQEVDICATGGWSRNTSDYSFKLKAQDVYEGGNFFPATFFAQKPFNKNKTLLFRNGGNDRTCRIKDAALQTIVLESGINVDGQCYRPVQHYINGKYKGVINLREPNNSQFAYANYGYKDEELDSFEMSPDSGYVQKCGDREAFDRLLALSKKATDDEAYAEITRLLDVEEYANYMAVELYLGNWDWPQNNVKAFRPRTDDGRFRFVLFDLDGCFSISSPFSTFAGKQTYTFNELLGGELNGRQLTKEIEVVTLFLNLLKNASFRRQFTDAFCLMAGSVFQPERCSAAIDSLTAIVNPEMAFGNKSATSTANDVKKQLSASRQSSMITKLKSYTLMQLSAKNQVHLNLAASHPGGRILLNGQPVPYSQFSGEVFLPIQLQAFAPGGQVFEGWYSPQYTTRPLWESQTSWRYYDQGSLDGTRWNQPDYDCTAWPQGNSPLGYTKTNSGVSTILSYGNASAKRPTYYFRKTFTLDHQPGSSDVFRLNYTADDGFVVYVNGTEAGRVLMNSGTVTYNSYSSTYTADPESGQLSLDAKLFSEGLNIIAVEVHNTSATSSDLWWDATLDWQRQGDEAELLSENPCYELPSGQESIRLEARFKTAGRAGAPISINEVSAANDIFVSDLWQKSDWIELYNPGSDTVDLAGCWLSPRQDNPRLFQIPAYDQPSTRIAPGSYMVLWCDGNEGGETQLHLPFRLDAQGGTLTLSRENEWTETLDYGSHTGRETMGRYPDGGPRVWLMLRPSPGAANGLVAGNEEFPQDTSANRALGSDWAGGTQVRCIGRTLYVSSDVFCRVQLFSIWGLPVLSADVEPTDSPAAIDLSRLPEGIYLVNTYSDKALSRQGKISLSAN